MFFQAPYPSINQKPVFLNPLLRYDHSLMRGLIGWWPMTIGAGTALYDLSSTRNTGTLTNTPVWRGGQFGPCLEFNGSSNYVSLSKIPSTAQGTVSCWFKPKTLGISGQYFLSSSDTATASCFIFVGISAADKLTISQRNNDTQDQIITDRTLTVDGLWHHAVFVSTGSAYLIYMDGIEEPCTMSLGSNTGDWFSDTTNRDNFLMSVMIRSTALGYFNGYLDDVRLWDRVLTAEEIFRLYSQPLDVFVNEDSLWYLSLPSAPATPNRQRIFVF